MSISSKLNLPYIDAHFQSLKDNWAKEKRLTRTFVTVSRQAGAYGVTFSLALAKYLTTKDRRQECPWSVFDKDLLAKLAQEHDLFQEMASYFPKETVIQMEENLEQLFGLHPSQYQMPHKISQSIMHLGQLGHAIIVGRGGNIVTFGLTQGVHVRLIGSLKKRIAHVQEHLGMDEKRSREFVLLQDKEREQYVKKYFNQDIDDPTLYHLVINTDLVSVPQAVQLTANLILKKGQ